MFCGELLQIVYCSLKRIMRQKIGILRAQIYSVSVTKKNFFPAFFSFFAETFETFLVISVLCTDVELGI
jgi:hypothetical protein